MGRGSRGCSTLRCGMPERRTCRVCCPPGGMRAIECWVWVEADSIYEAALLGYARLSQDGWLYDADDAVNPYKSLVVELYPPGVCYQVSVRKMCEWMDREGGRPQDIIRRTRMREFAD